MSERDYSCSYCGRDPAPTWDQCCKKSKIQYWKHMLSVAERMVRDAKSELKALRALR